MTLVPESCVRCGRELQSDGSYCDGCGVPLYLTQRPVTDEESGRLRRRQIEAVMSKFLNLEGLPVGVKLLKSFDEVPNEVKELEVPQRHCGMIQIARLQGRTFHAPPSKHQCKVAATALGLSKPSKKLREHQLQELYQTRRRFRTEDLLWSYIEAAPRLPDLHASVLYGPLGSIPTDPDSVVVVCNPLQAMKIIQSYQHVTGRRVMASVGAQFSLCIDGTATPISTKDLNIAIGCEGSRRQGGLEQHELVLGFPYSIAGALAEASFTLTKFDKTHMEHTEVEH
jgi:uncharacterized protein (DUF169 family)